MNPGQSYKISIKNNLASTSRLSFIVFFSAWWWIVSAPQVQATEITQSQPRIEMSLDELMIYLQQDPPLSTTGQRFEKKDASTQAKGGNATTAFDNTQEKQSGEIKFSEPQSKHTKATDLVPSLRKNDRLSPSIVDITSNKSSFSEPLSLLEDDDIVTVKRNKFSPQTTATKVVANLNAFSTTAPKIVDGSQQRQLDNNLNDFKAESEDTASGQDVLRKGTDNAVNTENKLKLAADRRTQPGISIAKETLTSMNALANHEDDQINTAETTKAIVSQPLDKSKTIVISPLLTDTHQTQNNNAVIRKVSTENRSEYSELAEKYLSKKPGGFESRKLELNLQRNDSTQSEGQKLNLGMAIRLAVNSFPSVKEAIERLFEQKEQVGVAEAGYFPHLNAGFNNSVRTSTGQSEQAFRISATQMLYDFGKVSSKVDIAQFGVERNYAGFLMAVDDLARDTANAFIEVQRYNALLDIADKQILALKELETLAKKRVEKGASSRSDEYQASSRVENAIALKLQFKAELSVWQRTLQSFIGTDTEISAVSNFPVEILYACTKEVDDFNNVPSIIIAEANRLEAVAKIEQSKAEYFPTLSLDASYEHFLNRSDINPSLEDQDLSATISFNSSLFQGGARGARSRSAEHALKTALAAKDTAYLDVTRQLRESSDKTGNLRSRLINLSARYETIVKTQELYRHQYLALGTRTLLDILNTEQEIHQSMFDQQNTIYDLYRLQIDCLYSTGRLREVFIPKAQIMQEVNLVP